MDAAWLVIAVMFFSMAALTAPNDEIKTDTSI